MYRIIAHWVAYPMDRSGVKSCLRGIVTLETPDHFLNGSNMKDVVRVQVTQKYPELQSTPILLSRVGYEETSHARS